MRRRLFIIWYSMVIIVILILGMIWIMNYQLSDDLTNEDMNQAAEIDSEPLTIDWHDYVQIAVEKQRHGPGEQGRPVTLDKSEESEREALYKVNGFNALVSDKISLKRSLRDIRPSGCQSMKYRRKLPSVSIIIPFYQEHWSTLLRTFISALNRAPKHIIKEVILVDDYSQKEFLKNQLDTYTATHYKDIVKIVRATKREGLIGAKLLGAKHATGDVLIFMDSHCECAIGWLPPLLDPITDNYKTVVCPFTDVIDMETFEFHAQDVGRRGAFDWNFNYKRLPRLPQDNENKAAPFESPVMAGGLFAISRKWFWELGGYDPGLEVWGGEQYDLSFKTWQCGGRMLDAPCSRIGHVYRKFTPNFNDVVKQDYLISNFKRVAEVWMDEYKEYIYKKIGKQHFDTVSMGDISAQLALRKKLNCKSFKWFLTEVAFDLTDYFPLVEPPPLASGEIINIATERCLTARSNSVVVEDCSSNHNPAQQFEFTWHLDLRPQVSPQDCLDFTGVPSASAVTGLTLFPCHNQKRNQHWRYTVKSKQWMHVLTATCLQYEPSSGSKGVSMAACSDSESQFWQWKGANYTNMKQSF